VRGVMVSDRMGRGVEGVKRRGGASAGAVIEKT
jgi:hypothetical protein